MERRGGVSVTGNEKEKHCFPSIYCFSSDQVGLRCRFVSAEMSLISLLFFTVSVHAVTLFHSVLYLLVKYISFLVAS